MGWVEDLRRHDGRARQSAVDFLQCAYGKNDAAVPAVSNAARLILRRGQVHALSVTELPNGASQRHFSHENP